MVSKSLKIRKRSRGEVEITHGSHASRNGSIFRSSLPTANPSDSSFGISRCLCESSAVRAVALLGPVAKEHHVRRFALPGVNLFSGNELDPTDQPDAVLIFGGDGTIHRHLGGLALKQIPTLVVPWEAPTTSRALWGSRQSRRRWQLGSASARRRQRPRR